MLRAWCRPSLTLRPWNQIPFSQQCCPPTSSRNQAHQKAVPFSTYDPEPLRILFCGSDPYSIACLEALNQELVSRPDLIKSIDVACRRGKPVGRGYKEIRHREKFLPYRRLPLGTDCDAAPVRDIASRLGLRIHEIDTFTGWNVSLHYRYVSLCSD